jgi:ABC1 family protein
VRLRRSATIWPTRTADRIFSLLYSAARTSIPDTQEATREIATRIAEEIDYRHEATNISAFSQLYRDHPFIRVPEVIHDASGERVLTMTRLDGLDWPAAQHAEQDMKNAWAEVIWRFSVGSHSHANLLHTGQQALVVIATANRDPAVFDDPDEFRLDLDSRIGVPFTTPSEALHTAICLELSSTSEYPVGQVSQPVVVNTVHLFAGAAAESTSGQ